MIGSFLFFVFAYDLLVNIFDSCLDEYLPKPEIPKRELQWENDLELRSKFIDHRVCKQIENVYKNYIKIFLITMQFH